MNNNSYHLLHTTVIGIALRDLSIPPAVIYSKDDHRHCADKKTEVRLLFLKSQLLNF